MLLDIIRKSAKKHIVESVAGAKYR